MLYVSDICTLKICDFFQPIGQSQIIKIPVAHKVRFSNLQGLAILGSRQTMYIPT